MTTPEPDYASAYADSRARLIALVSDLSPAELERVAPATPDWRVRDIVAHLAGVCDDVANGNMAGVATDDWTAAQVLKRGEQPIEQVLAEWAEQGPGIEDTMRAMPIDAWGQMIADTATHEQDIRGAIGTPGARDAVAVVVGFEWGMNTLGKRLASEHAGALVIEHEGGATVGEGDPASTLRASRFEVARAMAGRRSEAQMRAYDWDGPFVDLVLWRKVFTPPEADLVE